MPLLCPISTMIPPSYLDSGTGEAEVRAYKLGKRRWSYNQVEVIVREAGGSRVLTVTNATNQGTDNFNEEYRESAVNYLLELSNQSRVVLHGFLCYDAGEGGTPLLGPPHTLSPDQWHQWYLVQRSACCKGCTGPVIRDPRFLYLSFDEAGTHVGAKTFRLVCALYDSDGCQVLANAASPPIRVLANNDVPTGAAHLRLELEVDGSWEGWSPAGTGEILRPAPRPLGLAAGLDDLFEPMHIHSHVADLAGVPGLDRLMESIMPDSPYSAAGMLDLVGRPFQYL
ncbi:hypothetical protein F751_0676 [Auxenochlorella protothecoides]|uniref:Uncharacterized protein n=1 Tax=Auxenochlorella protothecoides TaxID=3075 RepID=A0A087SQI6_AUXPR|nr:hypothetical protein F751_0676 [Auxenochlorella protothecoides]KFM27990.1 hypothetical protein F751_0676 [Auxenochlorella protothecoides]